MLLLKKRQKTKNEPKIMFKVLVYGNIEGRYSSRDLEKDCKRDVTYMWLLNGEEAPNYQGIF